MTSTASANCALEGVDIGSADERIVADHVGDGGVDLALDGLILKLQIRERYRPSIDFPDFAQFKPAARRIARIGSGGGDVLGHDRAGADHDIVGDLAPA